jgi:hypothetical protein
VVAVVPRRVAARQSREGLLFSKKKQKTFDSFGFGFSR